MLDADLAEIYGYRTKKFNEQVKNNIEKFDEDFRFRLTSEEFEILKSKILTSSEGSKFDPQNILRSKKLTTITGANDAENLRCKNCTSNCDDARYTPVALKFCILLPTPEKVVLWIVSA